MSFSPRQAIIKAHYTTIYKLLGVNMLSSDGQTPNVDALLNEIAANEQLHNVKLTTNPDPDCSEIDTSRALAYLIAFEGMWGPWEERLGAQVETVRRDRLTRYGKGVFLVFKGSADIASPEFTTRRDLDNIVIFCVVNPTRPSPKKEISANLTPVVQRILTAIALGVAETADRRVENVADVCYLVEPQTGKSIYHFTLQGGTATRLSIVPPFSRESMEDVRRRDLTISKNEKLAKLTGLLIESLETRTSEFISFIAAWTALEKFANTTFKDVYDEERLEILGNCAPQSTKCYFDQLKRIKSSEYSLAQKFFIIAAILEVDQITAGEDAKKFKCIKDVRNSIHYKNIDVSGLLVENTQKLILKYMKLYIDKATASQTDISGEGYGP